LTERFDLVRCLALASSSSSDDDEEDDDDAEG
jgi:hypothetical protein